MWAKILIKPTWEWKIEIASIPDLGWTGRPKTATSAKIAEKSSGTFLGQLRKMRSTAAARLSSVHSGSIDTDFWSRAAIETTPSQYDFSAAPLAEAFDSFRKTEIADWSKIGHLSRLNNWSDSFGTNGDILAVDPASRWITIWSRMPIAFRNWLNLGPTRARISLSNSSWTFFASICSLESLTMPFFHTDHKLNVQGLL